MSEPAALPEEDPLILRRLERRRRLLQQVVAVGALVPVLSGLYGVLFGPGLTGERLGISGDSHYRYLSGLLLAIGLLFWSTVPVIEQVGARFRLLTLVVFIGGLARFLGMTMTGLPSLTMIGALGMELLITPIICFWQWRIARAYAVPDPTLPKRAPRPAPHPPVMPEDVPEPVAPAPNPPAPGTARSSI